MNSSPTPLVSASESYCTSVLDAIQPRQYPPHDFDQLCDLDPRLNRLRHDVTQMGHSYVITDAIKDENVLKFAVEYVGRYQQKEDSPTNADIKVEAIDTKEVLDSPERLEKITDYIIERHPVKTRNKEFTAMMCVSSIDTLIQYYELFAKKNAEGKHQLKVATIFSYTSNESDPDADAILDEDCEIVGGEGGNPHTRDKLEGFIGDYNAMFGTKYSTKNTQSFCNYYQDIAKKVYLFSSGRT